MWAEIKSTRGARREKFSREKDRRNASGLTSPERLFHFLHARPDRRGWRRALLDHTKEFSRRRRVVAHEHLAIVQFNPGFARVLNNVAIIFQPRAERLLALRLGRVKARFQLLRQARQVL